MEIVVIRRRFLSSMIVLAAGLALDGCIIVKTPNKRVVGADDANSDSFDPGAMVSAIWDSKVIPYLSTKAGPLPA